MCEGFSETLLAQSDTSELFCGLSGNSRGERLKITSAFVSSDERFCLVSLLFGFLFAFSHICLFVFCFNSVFVFAFYCNSLSQVLGELCFHFIHRNVSFSTIFCWLIKHSSSRVYVVQNAFTKHCNSVVWRVRRQFTQGKGKMIANSYWHFVRNKCKYHYYSTVQYLRSLVLHHFPQRSW